MFQSRRSIGDRALFAARSAVIAELAPRRGRILMGPHGERLGGADRVGRPPARSAVCQPAGRPAGRPMRQMAPRLFE